MKKHIFLKRFFVFALVVICSVSLCGCFQGSPGPAGRDGERVLSDFESYLKYLWDNELVDMSNYVDEDDFMVRYPIEAFGVTDNTQHGANLAIQSAVDISNFTHGKAGAGVIYKLTTNQNDEYTGDGYIITNYHVACNTTTRVAATDIWVYLYGMTDYFQTSVTSGTKTTTYDLRIGLKAQVIGFAADYDIAILKIKGSDKTGGAFIVNKTVRTEDYATAYGETTKDVIRGAAVRPVDIVSEKLDTGSRWEPSVGTTVMAVGNPSGYDMSVTSGIISMQSEYIEISGLSGDFRVMRVDTPIYSGNSGGGIFNIRGQLVGIVNARWDSEESYAMSYAIPLDTALPIANQFIYRYENETVTIPMTLQVASFGDFTVVGSDTKTYYENGEVIIEETVKVTVKGNSPLAVDTIINYMTVNGRQYRITKAYQIEDLLIEARTASNVTFN